MIHRISKKDICLWSLSAATGLLVSLFLSCKSADKPEVASGVEISHPEPKVYPLEIVHPGDPEEKPFGLELVQYFDQEGNPTHYTLWVDSVICRDKTCEVVQVNMKWDPLGNYHSYEVQKGSDLTKLDHVPFSKEDHAKLHRILKDRESPLREVTKEGLVGGAKKKKNAGVDGVAGATVLTLSSTVVIGAGYTCYDLWHWANGELCMIIRDKSSKAVKLPKLREYLASGKQDKIEFAITCLKENKVFDKKTVNDVIASLQKGHFELIKPGLEYLRQASQNSQEYFNSFADLYLKCNSEKRVILTTALSKSQDKPPVATIEKMSGVLASLESYHEVHLFLTYLEENKIWSSKIEKEAVKLLDHEKFFFSRRTYWFLKKQKLSDSVKTKFEAYFKKHQFRLL